jgi:hypothetical protein
VTFSLAYYDALLANLEAANRVPARVVDAFDATAASWASLCILRHDVDRLPWRAVAMARLEAGHGIRATYYFRCSVEGRFPEEAIRTISAQGHEVGYHYETLSQHAGDTVRALAAFERNLESFRRIAPCETVSMHGAPLSRHNNQDLLVGIDLARFGLRGDAVLDLARIRPIYITDTGGSWNAGGGRNFRDIGGELAPAVPDLADPHSAVPFLKAFARPLYISSHPERWPRTLAGRIQSRLSDALVNAAKHSLLNVRAALARSGQAGI